jgi:UDP-N-acetyl-D-mannosaminuronic acid dehydrogenase
MVYELENNSRTIGVENTEVGKKLIEIYSTFCKGSMVLTSLKVAEMTKVVENTFRDINIAYANELAKICNEEKIDVYEVIRIANMHPRVNILSPGPGVGGHCISVDPWFLVGDYPHITDIIATARRVNDNQPGYILSRVYKIMEDNNITNLSDVGFYGLTYKENVDDTRESPTLQLIDRMERNLAFGAKVFDPLAKHGLVKKQYDDFDEFLNGIKILVIMVAHEHIIHNIDKLQGKIIYDTRNCLDIGHVIKL